MRATTWTTGSGAKEAEALRPKERLALESFELAYLTAGSPDQPCVLWLHGFPRNAFVWRECVSGAAEAGVRSLAPDLPGLGESAGPQLADYSISAQARVIDLLLEALGVERATVVAEGLGAAVGLAVAALEPARVQGVVLADPWLGEPVVTPLSVAAALARLGCGELVLTAMRGARWLGRSGLADGVAPGSSVLTRELYLRPLLSSPERRARTIAFLSAIRVADAEDARRRFDTVVDAPVLLCRGPGSRRTETAARHTAAGPGAEPERRSYALNLPDRATRIIESDPGRFLNVVLPFVEAVR